MIVSGHCHCCSSAALHLCNSCGRWVCRECFEISEGNCGPCLMQAPPSLAYSFSGLDLPMPGRRSARRDRPSGRRPGEEVADPSVGSGPGSEDAPLKRGPRSRAEPGKRAGRVKGCDSCEANPDR